MIKVSRSECPRTLTRWADTWTQDLLDAIARYQKGESNAPAPALWTKYRKEYIRQSLSEMFHGKCAYCEQILIATSLTVYIGMVQLLYVCYTDYVLRLSDIIHNIYSSPNSDVNEFNHCYFPVAENKHGSCTSQLGLL